MSRSIHSQNEEVPPLDLSNAAVSIHHPRYDYNPFDQPPEIEPIEHTLREGFAKAGLPDTSLLLESYSPYNNGPESDDPWAGSFDRPDGIKNAEEIIWARQRHEQTYFENWDDDSVIEDAPTYLRLKLKHCRAADNPEKCVEDQRSKRMYWYNNMTWKGLYALHTEDTSLGDLLDDDLLTYHTGAPELSSVLSKDQNWFEGALLIDNDADKTAAATQYRVSEAHIYHESDFDYAYKGDALKRPDEFIDTYPQSVVIGHYANGSDYVLLPWSGGLTCQCHYKHEEAYRVMCKHELLASMIAGETDSEYLPIQEGIQVPDRVRRLYDPLATKWLDD